MSDTPAPDTEFENCYCQLDGVVDLLSRKYAMQVVCAVAHLGPVRYGELSDAFFDDVSSSTLSARLEDLTAAGLLSRERYDEIPPRVEYDITEDGAELNERLEPLLQWAEDHDIGA
ncbi:transcriptional regulator [Halobacterium sp. DL1]|jgi:DNA-binding HxlR family transcriptional regulator|nr:transcriptional regulator [Halobacterium sp. DL1]